MARMNASRENKCPNCGLVERATHLNVCPSVARTRLLTEGTELLENWLYQDCRTNRELAYWLIKYILLRGTRPMASLRPMSDSMHRAAISQEDAIGWREFMEGKVCKEIAAIQEAHCAISSCRMNGTDWMKHFISHLLHLSHSQWICRNITLHDKLRGTLLLRKWGDVIKELDSLIETDPEEFLLSPSPQHLCCHSSTSGRSGTMPSCSHLQSSSCLSRAVLFCIRQSMQ